METLLYCNSLSRSWGDTGTLKRHTTLDLDQSRPSKKSKIYTPLTSRDLNMLKLRSAELERLDIAHNRLTEEQEQHGGRLLDAMNQPYQTIALSAVNVLPQTVDSSSGSFNVLSCQLPIKCGPVKDEPLTFLTQSPSVSTINMENQEEMKLQRKRQRNRIAASNCRRRKLERIAYLEKKVRQMKAENDDFLSLVMGLREQMRDLKQRAMGHVQNGCQI
ncbi:transcription factor AP-1-like [Limulus polyphemus]|uniref:Transcription factor AP-1-like n=1 Tax=Limulus polyphemus TaxID=6850 RepID=A0ABM1BQA0_LIMPO|nr:transcription factor AP-1-like [Limulus polyphemus]